MNTTTRRLALAVILMTLARVAPAGVNMPTWQVNNQHVGNNSQETILTPANVSAKGNFVQLFAQPLFDSAGVVAMCTGQPLVMAGVSVNGAAHNVVFVGTQHGVLYAYDADTSDATLGTNRPLWERNLVPTTDAPFLQSDTASPDIGPEIAMTSTPVVDPATNTIFAVAKTRRASDNPATFHHYLYAIDITTGKDRVPPVEIAASFPGTASMDSANGSFPFNPQKEHLRCALTLNPADGLLYLAFASHTDGTPYHGDVLGYDPKTLTLKKTFASTRANEYGGYWNSGAGTAIDTDGNLLLSSGNGNYNPAAANGGDWGESIIKLATTGPTLAVGDVKSNSWTPNNYGSTGLDHEDADLGSGGLLLLPDLPATTAGGVAVPHTRLMAGGGKGAVLYVLDRSYLGGLGKGNGTAINPGSTDVRYGQINDNSMQEILETSGLFNTPAYFNGYLYCAPAGGPLEQRRFGYDPATGTYLGTAATARNVPTDYYQSAETNDKRTPFISSNGTASGIVWLCAGNGFIGYDAANVSKSIVSANATVTVGTTTTTYSPYKFAVPTVANGKLYFTAYTENQKTTGSHDGYLFVYGLAPTATGAPADPTDATAQPASANSIRVSWQDHSNNETFFSVRRATSPNGTFSEVTYANGTRSETGANVTSFLDTGLNPSTTYYYQVYAGNVVNGAAAYSHAAQTPTGTTTFPTYNEPGLVAFWPFEDAATLTAIDYTGNGHKGSLGSEAAQQGGGIIGNELFCHSGGQAQAQCAVADAADLRFTAAQSFTIAGWVNPQAIKATEQTVLVKSFEPGTGNEYGLYISVADGGKNGHWIMRSTAGPDIVSAASVATGAWSHVAMVQDGAAGTRTLYVNGAKVAAGAAQAADGTGPLWMGKQDSNDVGAILDGYLDEMRVYNRALAAGELPTLMRPPINGAVSNQSQGAAGTFPLVIAPLAAKKVEPRQGATAGTYRVALTFAVPATVGTVTLETAGGSAAAGSVGTTTTDATGTVLTVPLTGVGNGQNMFLHLANVQPGGGSAYVPFNVLWGDVSGDNVVDYIDARAVASAQTSVSRPLGASLSPYDLNCDGVVDGKDVSLVTAAAGGANLGAQAYSNMAFCAPAVASSQANTGTAAAYAFDLDPLGTRWDTIEQSGTVAASRVDPSYLMVDLGATCTVDTEIINWDAGAKTYQIDVSADLGSGVDPHPETLNGGNWSQRLFTENGAGWTAKGGSSTGGVKTDVGTACTGRYVRLWGFTRTTQYGYAAYDYQILGRFVRAASTAATAAPVTSDGAFTATLNAAVGAFQVQSSNSPTAYTVSGLPAGLSCDPKTGIIAGTPTATGTFAAKASATNGVGTGNTATLTVTVQTPFAAWQGQYFTAAELNNASVSGPGATPAGDGIANLTKYAFNLNPKASGAAGMPTVSTTTISGQGYLTMTYTRVVAATDITYTMEVGGDLAAWSSGGGNTVVVSTTPGADGKTQTVVARDLTAESGAARRFARVKITSP